MRFRLLAACVGLLVFSAVPAIAVTSYDLANANADAGKAQGEVTAAQNHMNILIKGLRAKFEASPEYINAKKQLDDSTAARDAEQQKVLDQLHASADYQSAVADRIQAKDLVKSAHEDGDPTEIEKAAEHALEVNAKVTQMDKDALLNDADYQTDNKLFISANTAMKGLEGKYNASLVANPDWQHAKSDLDQANSDLSSAQNRAATLQDAWNQEHKGPPPTFTPQGYGGGTPNNKH